jgi:hypothetical protein
MSDNKNVDKHILLKQLRYIRKVKLMTRKDLVEQYAKLYRNSKYFVSINGRTDRGWIEDRVILMYCAKNNCFVKGSDEYIKFKKQIKETLAVPIKVADKEFKERLSSRILFTRVNIAKMQEFEVEAYLSFFGYGIDGTLKEKRRALWEIYNKQSSDLPYVLSSRTQKEVLVRRHGKSSANVFVLSDILLRHRDMGWPEFKEAYGDLMPSVTRNSFYVARARMRKRFGEHIMPRLPKSSNSITRYFNVKNLKKLPISKKPKASKPVPIRPFIDDLDV